MKEYYYKEIVEKFGDSKDLIAALDSKVEYINGIDIIDKNNTSYLSPVNFKKYPNGLVIELTKGGVLRTFAIEIDKLKYFTIKMQEDANRELRKFIILKVLIGKFLLGTFGVIFGTMYATKRNELTKLSNNLLVICLKEKKKKKIFFAIRNKNIEEVNDFFISIFA